MDAGKHTVKNIDKIVEDLVNLYNTSSPSELCEKLHIIVLFRDDLPKCTNSIFVKTKENKKLILIKNGLKIDEIKKLCAHELAHAVMHSDINAICIESNKKLLKKLEKEADYFAKKLISYGSF